MRLGVLATASMIAALLAAPGHAQGFYVSGTVGAAMQSDSDNTGATSADFLTGNGGALPAGTPIASGTPVGWKTEFDNGMSYSAAVGYRYSPSFRGEVQLAMSKADVDTHKNVTLGGGSIDALDAGATAVFAPGQPERTGLLKKAALGITDAATVAPQPAATLPSFGTSGD